MAHIRLNTHPAQGGQAAPPVIWGGRDPKLRGPVVGTVGDSAKRNAIGVHSGSYGIYRALAIAAQELKPDHRPDFTNTSPAETSTLDFVGIARAQHAAPYLRSGQLVQVLEGRLPTMEGLFLYYHGHRQVPTALRAFIDMIRVPKSAQARRSIKSPF